MFRRLGVFALAVLCAGAAELTPAQKQANTDSFEYVWKKIHDTHWEAKPGGLDWQAVHDELRPQVDKATSTEQVRTIISGMLERLHQTHFGVFPSEIYKEFDSPGALDGSPGIDVRALDGHAVVTGLDADSPAMAAGVKPGWEILRVDSREIPPALQRIQETFKDSTMLDLRLSRVVLGRLNGPVGKTAKVEFLDGAGRHVTLDLQRVMPRGKVVKLGDFPPFYFWVEGKKVRQDIGYVRFNAFFDPDSLIKTVAATVDACKQCKGFVIDLRGNPGGLGALAMGLSGWFIEKSGLQLGTIYSKGTTLKFVVFPRPEPFRGPLAVLVDGSSASTSEIFAGGMKDLQRARIFGTRTAGAALPSMIEKLPNGDGFQYAMANYISQGGKPLEGIGVTPDEIVAPTRKQLLEGQDPALDTAIRWIDKQKNQE
jgi:carboxyl-terminal processing protease